MSASASLGKCHPWSSTASLIERPVQRNLCLFIAKVGMIREACGSLTIGRFSGVRTGDWSGHVITLRGFRVKDPRTIFFARCCLGKIPGGAPFSQLHKGDKQSRVDRP